MDAERLLNAAKAVRESSQPDAFDMGLYGWSCGTPGCVMGHYGARGDLQNDFVLTETGWLRTSAGFSATAEDIAKHFEISREQEDELFGSVGCGDARTPSQAADYIERFVAEHKGSQS